MTAFEINSIAQLHAQGRYEYVYFRHVIHTRQRSRGLSVAIRKHYVQLVCVTACIACCPTQYAQVLRIQVPVAFLKLRAGFKIFFWSDINKWLRNLCSWIMVFWNVMPCNLLDMFRCFELTFCLRVHGRKICCLLPLQGRISGLSWRRLQVSPKYQHMSTKIHGVTSKKTLILTYTTALTIFLTYINYFSGIQNKQFEI